MNQERCRVTEETNDYYNELEIGVETMGDAAKQRVYKDPYHIKDAICMNTLDYPDFFENLDADEIAYHKTEFYNALMVDIGEALLNDDYMKVGMLVGKHMKKHLDTAI